MKRFVLIFLLITGQAHAWPDHPTGYCGDLNKMYDAVESCEQNFVFSTAAKNCLAKLDKEINAASASLQKLLTASKDEQAKLLTENKANLQTTEAQLQRLLNLSDIAINDMNYYLLGIVQPHELYFKAPGEAMAFANGTKCFGEHKKAILSSLDQMERRYLSLDRAKTLAAGLATSSQQKADKLEMNAPTPLLKQSGSGKSDQGVDVNKSSISGPSRPKQPTK